MICERFQTSYNSVGNTPATLNVTGNGTLTLDYTKGAPRPSKSARCGKREGRGMGSAA